MRSIGIYLREEDELVGPFNSRRDAERFLLLMELSGSSSKGIEIAELDLAVQEQEAEGEIQRHGYRSSVANLHCKLQ